MEMISVAGNCNRTEHCAGRVVIDVLQLCRAGGKIKLSPAIGATSPTQFSFVVQRLFALLPPSQMRVSGTLVM